MQVELLKPARLFRVGRKKDIRISDCCRIKLMSDEQVTFIDDDGAEYDVVKKSWGFYATPSLNGRLRKFGLRAVIVRNLDGNFFILLVKKNKMSLLRDYLRAEKLSVIQWLDTDYALNSLKKHCVDKDGLRCLCGGSSFMTIFTYNKPPKGETKFRFNARDKYQRRVERCNLCGHFLSVHNLDLSRLYSGDYVSSTYNNEEGIRLSFERIISLDPAKSDNAGRVKRILEFSKGYFDKPLNTAKKPSIVDIGSGLCVFLHRMKQAGWRCVALDPDSKAVNHARERVKIKAILGDFLNIKGLTTFDVLTFNKVLEHVKDPISMLRRAAAYIKPNGFIYIEVPDGETAAVFGKQREEFFIDHLHAFSAASLAILISKAGFSLLGMERLCEPSGKYTLCAFLAKNSG